MIGFIADDYKMITLVNGKNFLMYKGYTYCFGFKTKIGLRMRCTNTSDCKAFIVLSHEGDLIKIAGEHTHKQQNYRQLSDGKYVKL